MIAIKMNFFSRKVRRLYITANVVSILVCGAFIYSFYYKNEDSQRISIKRVPDEKFPIDKNEQFHTNTPGNLYSYFDREFKVDNQVQTSWIKHEVLLCNAEVSIFASDYGIAHGITMYPNRRNRAKHLPRGGEKLHLVLGQSVNAEFYSYGSDFWVKQCPTESENIHMPTDFYWKDNIQFKSRKLNEPIIDSKDYYHISNFVIGIRRQDYANLHNWVRNVYNTFLVMIHFHIQPEHMTILFLDGHPFTTLDFGWETIFNKPVRVGHLEKPVYFEHFIWGFQENKGLITDFKGQKTSHLEDFRSFVLKQFNLSDAKSLDCLKLKITLIVRRSAINHPRNKAAKTGRKIFNEVEIISTLQQVFPTASVQPVLMDALPLRSQLEISSSTDLWIGMHGAGMSHVTFLPRHAGVIELFQKGFKTGRPWFVCFQSIAKWRGMSYDSWENTDPNLDLPEDFTIVPIDVIANKAKAVVANMCGEVKPS